ncbi:amino acid ABC transporter permease [Terasakiella sp. A23]|uniref:amino acid ABC transporter permease n=1 Tax=Terasakiella sp. FCG-A23 TaxID=3080561 RepID=UPI0029551457|nr:amino acid ABC transporter permease [Terasakiella sp. A23]MDV7341217.1 amino acid ABC transporter permease [Terasakiella sp. A23]
MSNLSHHNMQVLHSSAEVLQKKAAYERLMGSPLLRLNKQHGVLLFFIFAFSVGVAEASNAVAQSSVISILIDWTPLLFKGFLFNILISFLSMAIGTALGVVLGVMQVSLILPVRHSSWVVTQFFRNSPWLVLLFGTMFMLPFEFVIGETRIPFPDWLKAVIGLSLPVLANISEIVRGAIKSVPSTQWEAAESLAFTRTQIMYQIILPQCFKRMIPPWMNMYCLLTMATVLASIVGVNEVMTLASQISAAENSRSDLLAPLYLYIMVWFFIYTYPLARWTVMLERKFAVKL